MTTKQQRKMLEAAAKTQGIHRMNINKLKKYVEFHVVHSDAYKSILELIAAYQEAVAALKHYAQEDIRNARHYPPEFAKDVLATAKRLGVKAKAQQIRRELGL